VSRFPAHVMASAALVTGEPLVEIGEDAKEPLFSF
jgi:hypothetical protein